MYRDRNISLQEKKRNPQKNNKKHPPKHPVT